MTSFVIAVVILAFIYTVFVWIFLDSLQGRQVKPEKRAAGRVEEAGHLSPESDLRIWRIVRRIH